MTLSNSRSHPGWRWTLGLTILVALATALRFWRLGRWGLEGDEVFTLHDSVRFQLNNPRPLLYLLNHFVVGSFLPLDEFGLRLLPALFGVLSVPALFLIGRSLFGDRAAFFSALLLVFSPLHVYQSQYARYWSLVVFLSAIYPYAVFLAVRDRNPKMAILGILIGLLAVLAHPVSLFLMAGLSVWLLLQVRREHLVRLWSRTAVRWAALGMVGGTLLLGVRYVPMLLGWISSHDESVRVPDHLLALPGRPGVKQAGLLLAYLDGLTAPLILTGMLGLYLLWRRGEKSLALLLISLFFVPVGLLLILSTRTAISVTYMLSTAPVLFLGAGFFLARLSDLDWDLRPRWLLSAALAAIIVVAGLPTLISQYRDGRRQDFRGAALWLHDRLRPGDLVYADQFRTVALYLPDRKVQHLAADPVALSRSLQRVRASGEGGTLWIVAPYAPKGGHRTTPKLNDFKSWLYANCQLRESIGVARLDFRQNELQIYRCPPAPAARPVPQSELTPAR